MKDKISFIESMNIKIKTILESGNMLNDMKTLLAKENLLENNDQNYKIID